MKCAKVPRIVKGFLLLPNTTTSTSTNYYFTTAATIIRFNVEPLGSQSGVLGIPGVCDYIIPLRVLDLRS